MVFKLVRYFIAVIALLIAAFLTNTIFVSDAHASYFVKHPSGIGGMRWQSLDDQHAFDMLFEQATPVNDRAPKRVVRPVAYKNAGLKNLLKLKSLTPGGLALGAALTAAGYVWDAATEDITTVAPDATYQSGYYWTSSGGAHYSPASVCTNNWAPSGWTCNGVTPLSETSATMHMIHPNGSHHGITATRLACPAGSTYIYCNGEPQGTSSPISDQDFFDEVIPSLDWDEISVDDAGVPFQTPEVIETTNNLNNWFTENYTDNSQFSTTTSTSTTIINNDGSETTTETGQQDIPAFCSWAGIVCDAINWLQELPSLPTDTPMPERVIDEVEYTSGLPTNGICPADIGISSLHSQAITYSYTPQCQLATSIRPLLLSAAYLFAGYLLLGLRT